MKEEYIFTRFEEICEKYPDRPAIIFLGEPFSYARLRDLINRLATALNQLGVKKGDRVMVYLSNFSSVGYLVLCHSKSRSRRCPGPSHLYLLRNRIHDQ